jgi:hypothetical protein
MRDWVVYRTDGGSEVVPVADSLGHEPGDTCACLPNTEYLGKATDGGDAWMVVHNAWDGRE